jgi:hypothetical protein
VLDRGGGDAVAESRGGLGRDLGEARREMSAGERVAGDRGVDDLLDAARRKKPPCSFSVSRYAAIACAGPAGSPTLAQSRLRRIAATLEGGVVGVEDRFARATRAGMRRGPRMGLKVWFGVGGLLASWPAPSWSRWS